MRERKRILRRASLSDRSAIRYRGLSRNPQTKRKELLTEVGQMRVRDAAKEQFGTRIEHLNVHSRFESCRFASLGWRCDEGRAAGKRSALSRESLNPGVYSRVLLEFLSQVVNIEKIGEHPKQDLSRCRGLEMHRAQTQVLPGEDLLAIRFR